MMNIRAILLSILLIISVGCTQEKKDEVAPTVTIDQTIDLTSIMKYFFAGDVIATDVLYSPQGINFGELTLGKKVTKIISVQNSPLFEDFPTDIKIEERLPKVWSLDSNTCVILKTGKNCTFVVSAYFDANLFTSTKTARLVVGKKDGVDLYLELYGAIRNSNITSNQFESNYSLSMNKSFNADYAQFQYQERVITVKNESLTKYLRNDYVIPRLVGSSPTDFYISANDCMYPVAPTGTCDIRIIYKKWKTTTSVPDTEVRFPTIAQNYSLKYAQLVTYVPIFSDWSACSKLEVCTGGGTQARTIATCVKNGVTNVDINNCSGTLTQTCQSPAGSQTLNVTGGELYQTCAAGSTTWVSQSIVCGADYHQGASINCIADAFIPTFSAYTPATNPLTTPCTGSVSATRNITSCVRSHNNEVVANSKCSDPNPLLTFNSPAGTDTVNISNGIQSRSCIEGGTTWLITNVTCDSTHYRTGNTCSPIIYVATYSAYSSSPVETTPCTGSATVTRTVLSCKKQHNNEVVANELCVDAQASKNIQSPQGSQLINLTDTNTGLPMGTQSQICPVGGTVWNTTSTNCYQYYSVNGGTCVANSLSTPTSPTTGTVYSTSSSTSFSAITDLNATDLKAYKDNTCTQEIGTGLPLGLSFYVEANFTANVLTPVYVKATNSTTLKESSCAYLFSYLNDTIAPSANLSLNNGAAKTTLSSVSLDLSSIVENSGQILSMEVYEQASCLGSASSLFYANNTTYTPINKGSNLTISLKLVDAAGNKSSCIQDSILFGLESLPLYSASSKWMDFVDPTTGLACSGSGLCVHAGEKRVVRLDQTSCTGLSLVDDYSLLNWVCQADPDNAGKIRFVSTGMNQLQLSNLIDYSGSSPVWRTNKVNLRDATLVIINTSIASSWYSNPLAFLSGACYNSSNVLLPDTTQVSCVTSGGSWIIGDPLSENYLSGSAGTIYVVKKTDEAYAGVETFKSKEIIVNNDSLGLIVQSGVKLQSSANNQTLLSAVGRKYLFVEGYLSGVGTPANSYGVYFSNTKYSLLNYLIATNFTNGVRMLATSNYNTINDLISFQNSSSGIHSLSSSYNNFNRMVSSSNVLFGIYLDTSNNNLINKATTANNLSTGIYLTGSQNNTVYHASSSNNNIIGISLINSSNNAVSSSSFNSNTGGGIYLGTTSVNNKISAVNVLNNEGFGVTLNSSSNGNIIHNALILNNDKVGYDISSSNQNFASQLGIFLTTNSTVNDSSLNFTNSLNNKISGNIYIGGNTVNCRRSGTSSSNDMTGISSLCEAAGMSDYTLTNSGPGNYPSPTSFITQTAVSFPYDAASFITLLNQNTTYQKNDLSISPSSRGRCSSGSCVTYDFTLAVSDSYLRSRSNLPTVTNSAAIVTPGTPCPIEVAGNISVSSGGCAISNAWNGTYKTESSCLLAGGSWTALSGTPSSYTAPKNFLKNAIEIIDPNATGYGPGNHDGLCESGEACIYAANFGVYQGEGSVVSCQYDSQGGVSAVNMWGFSQNGQ